MRSRPSCPMRRMSTVSLSSMVPHRRVAVEVVEDVGRARTRERVALRAPLAHPSTVAETVADERDRRVRRRGRCGRHERHERCDDDDERRGGRARRGRPRAARPRGTAGSETHRRSSLRGCRGTTTTRGRHRGVSTAVRPVTRDRAVVRASVQHCLLCGTAARGLAQVPVAAFVHADTVGSVAVPVTDDGPVPRRAVRERRDLGRAR